MNFDLSQIQALAELATSKGLAEITITDGDQSVTIKTPASVAQPAVSYGAPLPALASPAVVPALTAAAPVAFASELTARSANIKAVTSPMVGTFYRAAAPDKPPFADKGQVVSIGQTLCILEAMKQMNQLESELAGTVVDVLVSDGTPVDYGQELFLIQVAG